MVTFNAKPPRWQRFTNVLLSWLPRYYELKLLFLFWLVFRRGANACYKAARRGILLVPTAGALIAC